MKSRICGIVAATLVLGLSACASDGAPGGGDTADSPSGEITYAEWSTNQQPTMKKIIEAFNEEYPDVTVNLQVTPWEQYWTKLQNEASTGTMPDVLWMHPAYFLLYATNDKLESIESVVDDGRVDLANYPTALVDFCSFDGSVYGVPKDQGTIALYYNKRLFDAAGVDYPTADWTLEDEHAAAAEIREKLKDDGVYGISFVLEPQSTYYPTIYLEGGHIISEDLKKSGYDSPEAIAGVQYWVDMMEEGISPSYQQLSDTDGGQFFASGKAAMYHGGVFDLKNFFPALDEQDIGIVELPKGQREATIANGLCNSISSDTENRPAAEAFLAFLGGERAAQIQAEAGTALPAYKGTQQPWLDAHPDLDLQVFLDIAEKYPFPFAGSKNTQAWNELENRILGEVWAGKKTAEEGCKELAEKMNALLAQE